MTALSRLYRSMLAQTLLLAGILLTGSIYLFAVRPVMDYPAFVAPDPRSGTVGAIHDVIWQALRTGKSPASIARTITDSPIYRKVMARNPQFRYRAVFDGTVIGEPPRYYDRLGLDRLTQARTSADPGVCVQLDRPSNDASGLGYISYINCRKMFYFEFSGIVRPIDLVRPSTWRTYALLIWRYSRSFLLPAMAVLLVCIAIIVFHVVMIRRIARLMHSRDEADASILSERGLPSEVLPLVRAVNMMIGRIADVEQRQRFFLSAAAHEMRTPLTVLRTRLEMLDQDDLKDKLVTDVRRLTRLVNELLTLMSVRERSLPEAEVDLASCCRRVVAAMDVVAMAKGIVLRLDGPSVLVRGDAPLIEVAITNLVSNAIAFSPERAAIAIAIRPDGCVSVADEGAGIPSAQTAVLFEPFVRLTKSPGGYGLGLTIVKAIADLHGASIVIDRADSGGALVTISFPRSQASELGADRRGR